MVTYRWAEADDLATIVAFLDSELKPQDWFCPKGMVQRLVTGEGDDGRRRTPARVMVAEEDGELVGLAVMGLSGQLWTLTVRRDHRYLGIGTELLRSLNPRWIRCKTDMASGDPREFYLKAGYKAVCHVPDKPHLLLMVRPAALGEQLYLEDLGSGPRQQERV